MRHFALILSLLLTAIASAREWPLWDNHESAASYAQRVNLPPTKTLDLGNGVKLELVLIPAGKFVMGTPEPEKPSRTVDEAVMMILLGAMLTIVLFVVLHFKYRKTQKRHFSLGWLLMLTATVGLFVGGIVRRNALRGQWQHYVDEKHDFALIPDNEKPAHEVTISQPFYMGKYTVTQEQYELVMKTNPSHFNSENGGSPTHPVERVSWDNAMSFCEKANAQLPTEAQWEYACRAGTTTLNYSGDGDVDLERVVWTVVNSNYKTHPVGGKSPNAFGLYDMLGNVEQWCNDNVGNYTPMKQINPEGNKTGDPPRMARGGCWGTAPRFCRSAYRDDFTTVNQTPRIGFRVVVPLAE